LFWGDFSHEAAERALKSAHWLAIERDGALACIGSVRMFPYGAHIGIVATREEHRNQGLATAMVNVLTNKALEVAPNVLINVEKSNAPAIRAYSSAGYRPYQCSSCSGRTGSTDQRNCLIGEGMDRSRSSII